jgi:hypothetical protein
MFYLAQEKIVKKRQRLILLVSACVLILMLWFPPFECRDSGTIYNEGYSFILNPPKNSEHGIASVNSRLLFIQSVIVIIAGYMFFLSFKPRKKEVDTEKKRQEFKIAVFDKNTNPDRFADDYLEKYLKECLPKPPKRGNC